MAHEKNEFWLNRTPNCCPRCHASLRVRGNDQFGDFICGGCRARLFYLSTRESAVFFAYPEAARIRQRVVTFISETLNVEPHLVTGTAWSVDSLGADSLDFVELIMEIEEELGSDLER